MKLDYRIILLTIFLLILLVIPPSALSSNFPIQVGNEYTEGIKLESGDLLFYRPISFDFNKKQIIAYVKWKPFLNITGTYYYIDFELDGRGFYAVKMSTGPYPYETEIKIPFPKKTFLELLIEPGPFKRGAHRVVVILDSTNNIKESSESNNIAIKCYSVPYTDLNEDGIVDMNDVSAISQALWSSVPPARRDYDLNSDGKIDMKDLSLVAKDLGKNPIPFECPKNY